MEDSKRHDDVREELEEVDEERGDETELADVEEYSEQKIKQLRERVKRCEEEKRSYLEDLQRTKADFLNSRKRLEEQLQKDKVRITEEYICELLPLADSFDLAMQSPGWEACDATWRKGIEGIYAQLASILKQYDVTAIKESGAPFDPHIHEAVANEPVTDNDRVDTVVSVIQTGYKMGDVVLRHAKVTVGVAA